MAASYLLPPGTKLNSFRRRGHAEVDQSWTLPFVPGGSWSNEKPVYVLTSRETASGTEEFAYDLQQLKRATIAGERTWGGANPGMPFPIDTPLLGLRSYRDSREPDLGDQLGGHGCAARRQGGAGERAGSSKAHGT